MPTRSGHQIYLPDLPAWREIVDDLWTGSLNADRTINRQALGKIVFADPEALRTLNHIVHPKMFARIAELIAELRAQGSMKAIVVEAAVLIEAQLDAVGGSGVGSDGIRGGGNRSTGETAQSLS